MNIQAAAKVLDVSESTLYRMIDAGKLAAVRHGGRLWIERAEIDDYFARLKAEAAKTRAQRAKGRSSRRVRTSPSRTKQQPPERGDRRGD